MIALIRDDVESHRNIVPWVDDLHVEQDLLLSLAMVALFEDKFLKEHIAMRGGTALHKIHLAPPARYSEDIDLVVITDRNEKHIAAGLKRVLRPILGERVNSLFDKAALQIRNLFRPSRILRLEYAVPSIMDPRRTMKIKIEVNVSERVPFMTPPRLSYEVPFQGAAHSAEIVSFDLNEMLGTKMRALFERDAGRDLFDLHCAAASADFDAAKTIDAFNHYMAEQKKLVRRGDFLEAFQRKCASAAFRQDMETLLRLDFQYDFKTAADWVEAELLARLPA